ncbi:hypothetical protein VKT23_008292 [Stygiomarasmius scandens]|uniref:F-box domain-containing protein n=1 Tax=Marasmiellus scandens TaxID=2682957 RepID=A0ABR1JIE9_9AGAR
MADLSGQIEVVRNLHGTHPISNSPYYHSFSARHPNIGVLSTQLRVGEILRAGSWFLQSWSNARDIPNFDPDAASYHSMPNVPQEVIEHIIDATQHCRRTLKACTLVSRAWLPRARAQLFREIGFPPPFTNHLVRRQIEEEDEGSISWTFIRVRKELWKQKYQAMLIDLTAKMNLPELYYPPWPSLTRTLIVAPTFGGKTPTMISNGLHLASMVKEGLLNRLPFKSLEVLVIRGLEPRPIGLSSQSLANFLLANKSLTKICLNNVWFEDLTQLLKVLEIFATLGRANLQTLALHSISLSRSVDVESSNRKVDEFLSQRQLSSSQRGSHLENLDLRAADLYEYEFPGNGMLRDNVVLNALFSHPQSLFEIDSLRTLTLYPGHKLKEYHNFLSHDRCMLTHVQLDLYHTFYDTSVLSRLQKLESLALDYFHVANFSGQTFLNSLRSLEAGPSLRKLAIAISSWEDEDVVEVLSSELDLILSDLLKTRHCQLNSVSLSVPGAIKPDLIRENLPMAAEDPRFIINHQLAAIS